MLVNLQPKQLSTEISTLVYSKMGGLQSDIKALVNSNHHILKSDVLLYC